MASGIVVWSTGSTLGLLLSWVSKSCNHFKLQFLCCQDMEDNSSEEDYSLRCLGAHPAGWMVLPSVGISSSKQLFLLSFDPAPESFRCFSSPSTSSFLPLLLLSLFSSIIWIKRQLSNVSLHNQLRKPKRSAICQNTNKKETSQLLFHQVTAITCPHSPHLCFVDWAPSHSHASHMHHYHTQWFLNYCNFHA